MEEYFEPMKLFSPFLLALLALYVNWITKFSANEEEAKGRVKQSAKNVILYLVNTALVLSLLRTTYLLWRQLTSLDPITRSDLFEIVMYVSSLLMALMLVLSILQLRATKRQLRIIGEILVTDMKQIGVINDLSTSVRDLSKEMDKIKNNIEKLGDLTELSESEKSILLCISKHQRASADFLSAALTIVPPKIDYFLTRLCKQKMISLVISLDSSPSNYYLEQPGREYLVTNNLI